MNIRDNHRFAKAEGAYSLPRRFTMAEPTETPPRGPTNLRIKFRSASVDQFIERYAVDVSRGGIFIRTREPLAVGTRLKLEFQLQDATPLLAGEGTVVWIREPDPMRGNATPGMGVRFDKLTPESQPTLEKILAEKTRLQQTGASQPAGPPAGLTKTGGGMAVRRSGVFQTLDPSAIKPGATGPAGEAATAPQPDAARPALGVTTKTSLPAAPAAAPMGPFRARTATGPGLRPAPVPSALFEPPTADDIDKALEALHETSGPAPAPIGGGGLTSGASAPQFVADDLSNEPTRVADVVDELVGVSSAHPAAAPETALEAVDTGAVVAMEDAPASGASSGAASAALDAPIGDELPEVEPAQPLAPEPRVENLGPIPIIGGVAQPIPPEKSTRFRAASSAYPILQRRRRGLGVAVVVIGAVALAAFGFLKLNWKERLFPKSSSPPVAAPIAEAPPAPAPAPQVDAAPPAVAAAEGAGGAPAKADDGTAGKPTAAAPAPAAVVAEQPPPAGKPADGKAATGPTKAEGAEHGAPKHPLARRRAHAAADDATAGSPAATDNRAADGAKASGEKAGGDKAGSEKAAAADKGAAAPAGEAAAPPAPVLKVTSTPSGAEVLIDGTSVGNTPFTSKTLDSSAPHAITVKKDGYEANERMIGGLDWSQPHGNSPASLKVNVKLRRTAPAPSATPAAPKDNAEPAEDTGGPYIKEIKPDSP
jgi:uncharacterized protein (TIGR02266 family)